MRARLLRKEFQKWKRERLKQTLLKVNNTNKQRNTIKWERLEFSLGFQGGAVVKNPPASAGDEGSTPGSGRSPGVRNGNPL